MITKMEKEKGYLVLFVFVLSSIALMFTIGPNATVTDNSLTIPYLPDNENSVTTGTGMNSLTSGTTSNTNSNHANFIKAFFTYAVDPELKTWYDTNQVPSVLKTTLTGDPMITVYALANTLNVKLMNQAMHIDNWANLNGIYIIMGSMHNPSNLALLADAGAYRVDGNPIYNLSISTSTTGPQMDSQLSSPDYSGSVTPDQFVARNELGIPQAEARGLNGTGVTIAIVDGGVDFGNSNLESAMALNKTTGLPQSFDTEGWSLVATPITFGKDVPLTPDNKTALLSDAYANKIMVNTSAGTFSYSDLESFGLPPLQPMQVNPAWTGPGHAPIKFGVGAQYVQDLFSTTAHGYSDLLVFYAIVIDTNGDGIYDSAVIDMDTSVYATYLYHVGYIKYFYGNSAVLPLFPYIHPDWNFTNDKIVSWIANSAHTGADFTFAKDFNGDGVNDFSFGSMANAYDRFNLLHVNQSKYGLIVNGVDPDGHGFVALHPDGSGFQDHGTAVASVAAGRGTVDTPVYTNLTSPIGDGWDNPYGNETPYRLTGAAVGAKIMSVAWGASPQDALLAWFWAAGMDVVTTNTNTTQVQLQGSEWKYTGNHLTQIASNSWGANFWESGWDALDWLIDLMSTPNLGNNTIGSPFYGFPGILVVIAAGNEGFYTATSNAFGVNSLKVGATRSSHLYANVYGLDYQNGLMAEFSSAGPKSIGNNAVDVVTPGWGIYSAIPTRDTYLSPYYGGPGNYSFASWSGTSAATPFASGAAAIVYQAYMQTHSNQIPVPMIIKDAITSSANFFHYPADSQGAGEVNASAAAQLVSNDTTYRFWIQSNATYNNIYWLNVRQQISWMNDFYASYDLPNDLYIDYPDWGYDNTTMMNGYHYDNSIATGNIVTGQTFNTQVGITGNTSLVSASPVFYNLTNAFSNTTVINATKDPSMMLNVTEVLSNGVITHRAILNFSLMFTSTQLAKIYSSDYIEIYVSGISSSRIRYMDLFSKPTPNVPIVWGQGDGNIGQMMRGFSYSPGDDFGYTVFKIGNPGAHPNMFFAIRSDTGALNRLDGKAITVTVRTYSLDPWNGVSVTPFKNGLFNVSINTAGWQAGFYTGWIQFTNTTITQFTPVTVKVNAGVISNYAASGAQTIGTYEINNAAYTSTLPNGYVYNAIDGDVIWTNFAVNLSDHPSTDYLVIKATYVGFNSLTDDPFGFGCGLGFVLKADDTGGFGSGQTINSDYQCMTDPYNGIVWAYIPWSDALAINNPFSSPSDSVGVKNYQLGLYAQFLTRPFSQILVQTYWLSALPTISINFSYNNNPLTNGMTVTGPHAMITISASVSGDPLLTTTTIGLDGSDTGMSNTYTFDSATYADGLTTFTANLFTYTSLDLLPQDSKSVSVTLINYPAPTATFNAATNLLNNTVISRSDVSKTFFWAGNDANGADVNYSIVISTVYPTPQPVYTLANTQYTSYTWSFTNASLYPDGWYLFEVTPMSVASQNGPGTTIFIRVQLVTAPVTTTVTTTLTTSSIPLTTSGGSSTPGFEFIIALIGLVIIVPVVVSSRKHK